MRLWEEHVGLDSTNNNKYCGHKDSADTITTENR